jgi:hypothetical protein
MDTGMDCLKIKGAEVLPRGRGPLNAKKIKEFHEKNEDPTYIVEIF